MYKPLVAVVGRPNVGKSTLFNAIVKKRISIVEDIPGVTRDRIYFDAEWLGQEFTMIDTGGIEFVDSDNHIFTSMRYQAELAIREADVILYVVDGKVVVDAGAPTVSSKMNYRAHAQTPHSVWIMVRMGYTRNMHSATCRHQHSPFGQMLPRTCKQ